MLTQKHQASLGPATTLIDSLLYLTYFLAISTTTLVSKGIAVKDWRGLQKTTSHVSRVSCLHGTEEIMKPSQHPSLFSLK